MLRTSPFSKSVDAVPTSFVVSPPSPDYKFDICYPYIHGNVLIHIAMSSSVSNSCLCILQYVST